MDRTPVLRDPVFLNRTGHILDQLYAGGWTAAVDAAEFSYRFRRHSEDRKFLGTVHPADYTTIYVYAGLPMGGANSPSLTGRFGLAFVSWLLERSELSQGHSWDNCWWTGFRPTGE